MVSPVLTENRHTGGFLIADVPYSRLSMDQGTIYNSGGSAVLWQGGTVMSQAPAVIPTIAPGANTGTGTAGAVTLLANVATGVYVFTATAATVFDVVRPDGARLKTLNTGVAYADEVGVTITAGGTPFVAGDTFTLTVPGPLPGLVGAPTAVRAGTGNGTISVIAPQSTAKLGTYVYTATSATNFTGVDPSGDAVPPVTVGTPYVNELAFTITAGGTAFVAGDTFTITVPVAQIGALTNYTGASPATCILYDEIWVNAGQTVKVAIVARLAEINRFELVWDPTVLASASMLALQDTALAQLAALQIVAR